MCDVCLQEVWCACICSPYSTVQQQIVTIISNKPAIPTTFAASIVFTSKDAETKLMDLVCVFCCICDIHQVKLCRTPTPLSHWHATRIIPEFWHSHGHVNPGSRPCLRAGFRPGFATRLRHNRIVSVKKWRKTDERGLSARRGCFCRSGARIRCSVSCRGSKEQCRISYDCRRAGKARLSAHARVMSAENKSSQEKVQVHR